MTDQTDQVIEVEDQEDEEESEAFIEYDIASYPSDFTLDNLYSQWKKGSIEIPPFQRQYVWNIRQASLLIDSFMMGLPVPPVFLYVAEDNKYLVIDGQQRLKSIFFFFEGYFGEEEQGKRRTFKLDGLDKEIRYAGKAFADFSEEDTRKLEGCILRAINIRQIKPNEHNTSVFHIFERLNTGGTPLRPQEIRNCVFSGKFVSVLQRLNLDANWRKIIGKDGPDKYQKDLELILRLATLLDSGVESYESPMKEFLNAGMERNRVGDSKFIGEFVTKFPAVCAYIVENLSEKPFHVRGPINTAYLDSVFCALYRRFDDLPENLTARYEELKVNSEFNDEFTRSGTQQTNGLRSRFDRVECLLLGTQE